MRVVGRSGSFIAVGLVVAAAVATTLVWINGAQKDAVAYFSTVKGLYPGDEVAIMGVGVGEVDSVDPQGSRVRVEFHYDAEYKVPANAKAVIVAPTLVTSRYIQLTPPYFGGPTLADGAVIPLERTAVPVEFDAIKDQVERLASALGPEGANKEGSLSRAVDRLAELATADGKPQGSAFHDAINELSHALATLSSSRGDLFGTVQNLQVFTSALVSSRAQIVELQNRLADVSNILEGNKGELASALEKLGSAARNVARFVERSRGELSSGLRKTEELVTLLADEQLNIGNALHVAPHVLANFYNIYDPATGALGGQLVVSQTQSPALALCATASAMAAGKGGAEMTSRCREYLNPLVKYFAMQHPPVGVRPVARPGGTPESDPAEQHRTPDPGVGRPNLGSAPKLLPAVPDALDGLMVPEGGR